MFFLKKIIFITLLIIAFTTKIYAFPHGCEVKGFGFNQNHLILNESGEQTFYLIQNRSNEHIEMERFVSSDVFMSPALIAKLEPSNWAAFASDIRNLQFQCFISREGHSAKVNCQDVIDVCQYPRVRFALSNMGNYWVSINKTQQEIINDAAAKGILLRW